MGAVLYISLCYPLMVWPRTGLKKLSAIFQKMAIFVLTVNQQLVDTNNRGKTTSSRPRVISPEVMSPKETNTKKVRISDFKWAVTLRNFYH